MEEKNSINKYRAKKERKDARFKLVIFVLIVLVIVLIASNWQTIFAPFKDIGLKLGKGGFPVTLPGSTQYRLGEMGENFYLMTDTYLYMYNGDGAEISGIQHGFQNPYCVSNDKRTLVYDVNGTSFKMFSKKGEVFRNTLEDSIVFGQIGSTNRTAMVTTSTRYFNYLYVFSADGKQIFRWASPDEKIMGLCFGHGDNTLYASVIGESNGSFRGSLVKFDLTGDGSEVWRTPLGDKLTYSLERCSDGIYVVASDGSMLINESTGEITASCRFANTIDGIPKTDGLRVVIFHDSASNKKTIVAYDEHLEPRKSVSPEEGISAFDVDSGRFYMLSGNILTVLGSSLNEIKTFVLDDEYSDIKVINGNAYLFGYNSVDRVKL